MKGGVLGQAVQLAAKVGYVFIATADVNKWPHVAVARIVVLKDNDRIAVNEWFCPGTSPIYMPIPMSRSLFGMKLPIRVISYWAKWNT